MVLPQEGVIDLKSLVLLVSLKEKEERLATIPITIVVESLTRSKTHVLADSAAVADASDRLGGPQIATMVDTDCCFREHFDIAERIDRLGKSVTLVHISDSDRGLPGEGDINFGRWAASHPACPELRSLAPLARDAL
jgi:D-psicose/D-tagatose/L-ribulose 3-epimerase